MTLTEIQQSYKKEASKLGEYGLLSKTELANGYCDADEELDKLMAEGGPANEKLKQQELRSAYLAALVVRYWYKIFEWMNDSSSLLVSQEDYVDWLVDSLLIAFRYRTWRTPYKMKFGKHSHEIEGYVLDENGDKIVNPYYYMTDPNAPDKIFNRCIFSARGRAYQFANKQKRKDGVHRLSLDEMLDENGDFAASYSNAYVNEDYNSSVGELIKTFLKRGELKEALIVDGIAFGDTGRAKSKKEGESVGSLDTRKLVKHLNNLDEGYVQDFYLQYADIVPTASVVESANFKAMNNSRIYKCIEKTIQEIKQTPALLSCLI